MNSKESERRPWAEKLWLKAKSAFTQSLNYMTAQEAYNCTSYGVKDPDLWIGRHQKLIGDLIESKAKAVQTGSIANEYYATYSLSDEDAKNSTKIFEPFVQNGFSIQPLTGMVDGNVYLISWRHPNAEQ